MTRLAEARATRHPAAVLWWASGLPALGAGAVLAACSTLVSLTTAASVGVGVAVAIGALGAGPVLLALLRSVSPPAAMLLALLTYGTVVVVLAVVYLVLLEVSWLSGRAVAAGMVAATLAWTVGMILAVPRLRILLFGSAERPIAGSAELARDDSPQSPSGSGH